MAPSKKECCTEPLLKYQCSGNKNGRMSTLTCPLRQCLPCTGLHHRRTRGLALCPGTCWPLLESGWNGVAPQARSHRALSSLPSGRDTRGGCSGASWLQGFRRRGLAFWPCALGGARWCRGAGRVGLLHMLSATGCGVALLEDGRPGKAHPSRPGAARQDQR